MINEHERLKAVNRFKQLDAGLKSDLNNLVTLLAQICDVPVALVSLIDDNMQWFKASVGTGEINCNERELSFCQQTILQDDILIVPDATKDLRFANLPIVAGEPHIKFYAGVPLITYDGYAVGTLCILHVQTIELSALQTNALKVLGKQVLNLIELNWSMQSLMEQNLNTQRQQKLVEDSEIMLKTVFDSSRDIHLLVGRQMEVLAFNKTAFNYIKANYDKEITIGAQFLSITNRQLVDATLVHFNAALDGKTVSVEWMIKPEVVTPYWLNIIFEPVKDPNDIIIAVSITATDITEKKLNAEKLNKQNTALQRIATIRSHELRRPVASLMGLMEVLKLDENYVFNSYYPMIESTINELDIKIKDIVHDSEATLNSKQ